MGRIIPPHAASRHHVIPPLVLLEPLIERTTTAPHHWYWLGDFRVEGDLRCAAIRYEGGTFTVARLLWAHAKNASMVHRSLRNDCGLVTCVNPDHFSMVEPKSGRFCLPDPCKLFGGDVANVVRVDFTTTHILIEGAERYVCDRKRAAATKIVPNHIEVTCRLCMATWKSLGRPTVSCL